MPRSFAYALIAVSVLSGCYDVHDVELAALEEADASDTPFVDAGADSETTACVAIECPSTAFGAACCTTTGTCGVDGTALGLGCFDTSALGGGAAGSGGGLPPGFFGGGAAGSGGGLPPGFFGGGAAGTGGQPD